MHNENRPRRREQRRRRRRRRCCASRARCAAPSFQRGGWRQRQRQLRQHQQQRRRGRKPPIDERAHRRRRRLDRGDGRRGHDRVGRDGCARLRAALALCMLLAAALFSPRLDAHQQHALAHSFPHPLLSSPPPLPRPLTQNTNEPTTTNRRHHAGLGRDRARERRRGGRDRVAHLLARRALQVRLAAGEPPRVLWDRRRRRRRRRRRGGARADARAAVRPASLTAGGLDGLEGWMGWRAGWAGGLEGWMGWRADGCRFFRCTGRPEEEPPNTIQHIPPPLLQHQNKTTTRS